MKASIHCDFCEACCSTSITARGLSRLPSGWKRHDAQTYCKTCWRDRYVLRAATFPVVGPIGCDWNKLREALNQAWKQSTELANWAMNEFAKADVIRTANMKKLPPMPHMYLYPNARARIPNMACQSVGAILRSVEQHYRQQRLAMVWLSEATLPLYRYPYPYSVHNQAWKAYYGENGQVLIDVPLNGEKHTLVLKRGDHFRWQVAAFDAIAKGKGIQGELQLYRQRASSGDHRSGMEAREAGGGARIHYRVMAKLTAWLPITNKVQARTGCLRICTTEDAFCIAETEGKEIPWRFNGDHVRRWATEHHKRLKRLWEDSKSNQGTQSYRGCDDRRRAFVEKHHRRIITWCHQVTAALANLADRQKVAEVQYDDRDHRFVPDFPWSQIPRLLAAKLEERGIQFSVVRTDIHTAAMDKSCKKAA